MTKALWEDVTPSFLRETYVLFVAQLTLDFPGGYGMFGRRLEKHRGEPVTDGQVAFLYYRAGTESGLMTATAAAKAIVPRWKSHATLTLLAKQDLPPLATI